MAHALNNRAADSAIAKAACWQMHKGNPGPAKAHSAAIRRQLHTKEP